MGRQEWIILGIMLAMAGGGAFCFFVLPWLVLVE